MRIAVTGSSGLVGSAVIPRLREHGYTVIRLVRSAAAAPDAVEWDPTAGHLDPTALAEVDAVIHLAGENISEGRWTAAKKRRIMESRRLGTTLIAKTLAAAPPRPRVLLSASAVGYYGDRGDEVLTEDAPPGTGFLAEVCKAWESATGDAAAAGVRVVLMRTGVVLSSHGGALAKMLPPFRMGLGGPLGSGNQFISWISITDVQRALEYLLTAHDVSGPVNVVSPNPVRNREFAERLGKALHRPAVLPVPAFAARLAVGDMADEALLASQRAVPERLMTTDFAYEHPTLDEAFAAVLATA